MVARTGFFVLYSVFKEHLVERDPEGQSSTPIVGMQPP
jgi:hypothetical protein